VRVNETRSPTKIQEAMGSIGYMSCFYNKICKYSTTFLSQSKPQSEKEV
jgi:hypothetical protein